MKSTLVQAKDVMRAPQCCQPGTTLQDIARMMIERDCGAIPVIDESADQRLVGIVTDRDIVCRAVAEGQDTLQRTAQDVMSSILVVVAPESTLEECCDAMRNSLVRRLPVVDPAGRCCGIISQADLASHANDQEFMQMIRRVSQATPTASRTEVISL
jgi:CBS domain-containing protein